MTALAALIELLMDLPDLLVNIHALPSLHLFPLFQLPVIVQSGLFPPRGFLLANDWLSSHTVKYITALRRQPLEVRRDVACGEVGG